MSVIALRLRQALWPIGFLIGISAEWFARSSQTPLTAMADLAVGWAFIASGLIGWSRRPRSRVGLLLTATGFAWFLGTFEESDITLVATLGAAMLTFHRGPLFHAIIGYPGGRLSGRLGTAVVILGYLYAAIVPIAQNNAATIVLILLVMATTIRGYFSAAGPDREARTTAIAAGALLAVPLAGGGVLRLIGADSNTEDALLWGYEAVLIVIAVGLLADLLRGRWAEAAVTKLIVDLGAPSKSGTLPARLAHALGDPSLFIAYWLPEANGYVDEGGTPLVLPVPGSGRAVTVIEDRGERIAALVHDAAVLDDAGLDTAVASAARIAVSNARLQADVRRQVAEIDASRRRILEAGDAQRRRLQHELQEGAYRRLGRVQELLEFLRRSHVSVRNAGARVSLEIVDQELENAQIELQELAAGIHPTVLTEQGLGAALSALTEQAPVQVRLSVSQGRLPPELEAAVYFTCSEALANVAKHAHASQVTVDVAHKESKLSVTIADDGVGGADLSGSGLRGLADRVEAMGGHLMVVSPTGGGTLLRAELPFPADW